MFSIKHIDIVLENCDVIRIDGKHLGFFVMDNIRKRAGVIACNAFSVYEIANDVFIEISPQANRGYHPLGIESETDYPFDRLLRHNDITSIEIETDDESLHYFVDWTGGSAYDNESQTGVIGKNGCLYLVISQTKTAKEYFNDDLEKPFKPWEYGFNGWMRDEWGDDTK